MGRLYDGGSKYEQQETCCETICPLPTSIKRYIRQPPLSFLYQSSSFQISITQRVESMGIRSRDELLTCWTAFFCLHICHAQHFGLYPQDMSCAHLLPSGWIQVSVWQPSYLCLIKNHDPKLFRNFSHFVRWKSKKSRATGVEWINWFAHVKTKWLIEGLCVRRHLELWLSIESPHSGKCVDFLLSMERYTWVTI